MARSYSHIAGFQYTQSECLRRSAMEMSVGALDHYNVSTRKLKETVQFYEDS